MAKKAYESQCEPLVEYSGQVERVRPEKGAQECLFGLILLFAFLVVMFWTNPINWIGGGVFVVFDFISLICWLRAVIM